MKDRLTPQELHATTGGHAGRIGASRFTVLGMDRGHPIAVIGNPSLRQPRRRQRTLLPEFKALMAKAPGHDLMEDLDAVRGDR